MLNYDLEVGSTGGVLGIEWCVTVPQKRRAVNKDELVQKACGSYEVAGSPGW